MTLFDRIYFFKMVVTLNKLTTNKYDFKFLFYNTYFIFYYKNLADGYKMVGNAVPPQLAKVIAEQICADLFVPSIEDELNPKRNVLSKQVLI